jgi:ATP-binding protein involved in chromosome partitioning
MDDDTPVIWRGPIVTGIIRQFLRDVDWRGTQYLIIDLPPGTGDAQLTLAQSAPIDGAIVVTTPSDLALLDAARGLQMFKTLNVDVLGIVENMSYFVCDECGKKHHIFGEGGGQREAKRLGTDFLGEIPLDAEIRAGGDQGKPIMILNDEAPAAKAFLELATKIAEQHPADTKKKKGFFSFLRA